MKLTIPSPWGSSSKAQNPPNGVSRIQNKLLEQVYNNSDMCAECRDKAKKSHKGTSALMFAAQYGYISCIEQFINEGMNINDTSNEGNNALHFAAFYSQPDTVEWLLEKGMNSSLPNAKGMTPLHAAVNSGNPETVRILVDYLKINNPEAISTKDAGERTPLDVLNLVYHDKTHSNYKLILGYLTGEVPTNTSGGRRRLNRARTTRKGKSKKNTRRNKK